MDQDFGPDFFNETLPSAIDDTHVYSAEGVAIMLGALGAMVASIIYSVKNVKRSSCCAGLVTCDQRTAIPASKNSVILESSIV